MTTTYTDVQIEERACFEGHPTTKAMLRSLLAERQAGSSGDGIRMVAAYIQKKADDYAENHCSSDFDTSDITYHFGQAGMEYHHALLDLAEEIVSLQPQPPTKESVRGVTDEEAKAALQAYDDQSMQHNDARYVCMRAALTKFAEMRSGLAERINAGESAVPVMKLAFDALHRSAPIPEILRTQSNAARLHTEAHAAVRDFIESRPPTQPSTSQANDGDVEWVERDCEACNGSGGTGRLYGGPSQQPSAACDKCRGTGKLAKPSTSQAEARGGDSRENIVNAAVANNTGKWPEELTSGVMFFRGERITRKEFYAAKDGVAAHPAEPAQAAQVPDGWVLMPREPTMEMIIAGRKRIFADMTGPHMGPSAEWTYAAMLAAAPTPTKE